MPEATRLVRTTGNGNGHIGMTDTGIDNPLCAACNHCFDEFSVRTERAKIHINTGERNKVVDKKWRFSRLCFEGASEKEGLTVLHKAEESETGIPERRHIRRVRFLNGKSRTNRVVHQYENPHSSGLA